VTISQSAKSAIPLRPSGHDREGRRSDGCRPTELPPETAGHLMRTALAPFHRYRLAGAILGPAIYPPAAVLYRYRVRIDDTPVEYDAPLSTPFRSRPCRPR
jgi:hypothetical protein